MEKYNHKVQTLTWAQLRNHSCSDSHHFHVPGMHQIGFVVQNVPYFYMFISWCSDKAPFNLTAELQSWRKYDFILTVNNLTRRQNNEAPSHLFSLALRCIKHTDSNLRLLHREPSVWKRVYQREHPDSRQSHPLCWPETQQHVNESFVSSESKKKKKNHTNTQKYTQLQARIKDKTCKYAYILKRIRL